MSVTNFARSLCPICHQQLSRISRRHLFHYIMDDIKITFIYYINIYPYSSGIKGPSDKGHMICVIGKVIKSPTKEEILSTTINLNIRHLMGLYKNALNCLKIIRIINQRKHNWVLVQFLSNFNSQKQGRPDMAGELPYQQLNQFTLFNTWTSQNSTFLALIEKN